MLRKSGARLLLLFVLLAPSLAAVAWTCHPAAAAAWAVYKFAPVKLPAADWDDPTRLLELRRHVQQHFLGHSVYIPMEDIVVAATSAAVGSEAATTSLLMQKACGRGRLFIWIPFKFHLPISGEKVLEWCWKPQTNDA